ncbi:hypothetical protein BAUCODRAFT_70170 [Baudoinia panamericana UAMH 10762]|uniref:Uncharacterized protein n=1 Tax=Baudoinia panamericana (strain UAMH 10762) TaxID=717646 RepID=M2LQB7_BAUPA|nr:uncharacterized protein BAUCODRAFT_70170 [Baudoinia panamericana UAMH 10762]EMC96607.1 hypothetical protein BAUCODRAFT_70170 [Baudoinia panamericana UAMH 10762]
MADTLIVWLRKSLPEEIATLVEPYISQVERGQYQELLQSDEARKLFGHDSAPDGGEGSLDFPTWSDFIFHRLGILLADRSRPDKQIVYFCIGYAALSAFVQSNVTGPPLPFLSAKLLFTPDVADSTLATNNVRAALVASLAVDGISAYRLTPNVELLCLADAIMTCPAILKTVVVARWTKMRVAFLHQRLLSEPSSTLQNIIYDDLDLLADAIHDNEGLPAAAEQMQVELMLERTSIHLHHGLDKLALQDLQEVKKQRCFEYALTGRLGKRTRYQGQDVSQLVVLAKSTDASGDAQAAGTPTTPLKLDLNDDTLLESISFAEKPSPDASLPDTTNLPPALRQLDAAAQPQLHPLDSIVLLLFASSITNTSPQHGLTREETLPYVSRVLDGGSSNWQVYTQALLVRSRIEGYRSRTIERGLLQLQALVDQSAPNTERLRYVFQLATPMRWELEAELAARWVQLGGLRSALDIYERLEMWAEAALCWAATEREDKAKRIVRRQLFHATAGATTDEHVGEDETWEGSERMPPPPDAARLYCILGDLDQSTEMYQKAWDVSGQRYARAQRLLGRYYLARHDYVKAAAAYSKSLTIDQLNHGSWFALGCCLLELAEFDRAVEAFSRCLQLDETDAEAWSNLAASLLRLEPGDPQEYRSDALKALKRAAALKHDSYRIWENVLTVAASVHPPDYATALSAQKRLIDLRGATDGERCIDEQMLSLLAQQIISSNDRYDPAQPGLARLFVKMIDENVVPLITGSPQLWHLVAKIALWRNKPFSSLDAEEKAWRVVTAQPRWEADEQNWNAVVDATVRLCSAYESLGPMERTEGMGAGELVAKDWKFKARSAVRGILGKGKAAWEGTAGWERLQAVMEELKR